MTDPTDDLPKYGVTDMAPVRKEKPPEPLITPTEWAEIDRAKAARAEAAANAVYLGEPASTAASESAGLRGGGDADGGVGAVSVVLIDPPPDRLLSILAAMESLRLVLNLVYGSIARLDAELLAEAFDALVPSHVNDDESADVQPSMDLLFWRDWRDDVLALWRPYRRPVAYVRFQAPQVQRSRPKCRDPPERA